MTLIPFFFQNIHLGIGRVLQAREGEVDSKSSQKPTASNAGVLPSAWNTPSLALHPTIVSRTKCPEFRVTGVAGKGQPGLN
jgi:hypothetical protein